jgi:hypothetical protein
MAMLRYLPILCTLAFVTACKSDRTERDSLPVAPGHEISDIHPTVVTGITDAEMQMYSRATHLARQLEIDPVTEAGSMKAIVESCGLSLQRYHEIRLAVEDSTRSRLMNEQILKKLRD